MAAEAVEALVDIHCRIESSNMFQAPVSRRLAGMDVRFIPYYII